MSRSSLSLPISILAGFGVFILLLLLGTLGSNVVAQDNNCEPYPTCGRETAASLSKTRQAEIQLTADAANQPTTTCYRSETKEPYPCPSSTPTETPEGNSGGNNGGDNSGDNQQPTATNTFTPTSTRTVTVTAERQETSVSAANTPTSAPPTTTTSSADEAAQPSPTTILPPGVTAIACVPGETVEFSGAAEPNTPLLLFFADRPVGGGTSDTAGAYRLRLQVGDERPGVYLVEVRKRVGRDLVDQYGCEVPPFTPTPTLMR